MWWAILTCAICITAVDRFSNLEPKPQYFTYLANLFRPYLTRLSVNHILLTSTMFAPSNILLSNLMQHGFFIIIIMI